MFIVLCKGLCLSLGGGNKINKPYIQKPVIHVDIIVHMKNQSLLWFQTQPFNEEELKD